MGNLLPCTWSNSWGLHCPFEARSEDGSGTSSEVSSELGVERRNLPEPGNAAAAPSCWPLSGWGRPGAVGRLLQALGFCGASPSPTWFLACLFLNPVDIGHMSVLEPRDIKVRVCACSQPALPLGPDASITEGGGPERTRPSAEPWGELPSSCVATFLPQAWRSFLSSASKELGRSAAADCCCQFGVSKALSLTSHACDSDSGGILKVHGFNSEQGGRQDGQLVGARAGSE